MNQPSFPDLPPMMPPPRPGGELPSSAAFKAPPSQPPSSRTNRLRQALTAVAGGGFILMLGVGVGEITLPKQYKPTTWLAIMEAQTDLGIFNQKLGEKPGTVKFTEAEYRAKLAEAERTGQAKAELVFQQRLAVVQADKERVVGAYQTLYQRANLIAQAAVQLESVAMQFRQRMLEMSNGGRSAVIGFSDMLCAIGSAESCNTARQTRESMISESDALSRGDVSGRIRKLMTGVQDPADLIVKEDRRRRGVPSIQP